MNEVNAIIINYNTKTLTCNCIKLLKENLQGIKNSILVVDNASNDDSLNTIKKEHPDVSLIKNSINTGFAFACNQAANISYNADFLLFANSDTEPEANAIKKMLEFMKNNPLAAIVGAKLINPDGSIQHSFANWPCLTNEFLGTKLLQIINPEKYPKKSHKIKTHLKVTSVIGAFFMIRNDVFKQIKGFDERFFFFMEETDLCRKIINKKLDIIFNPEIEVTHLQGKSANKNPEWSRHNFYRSKYQFINKWDGKTILALIYLKNMTTISLKISFYFLLNILSLLLCKKLKIKLRISYWLLKNHFLGFPPYIKKQIINTKPIPQITLNNFKNELKIFNDYNILITQQDSVVIIFQKKQILKNFIKNHAKIQSIGIPVLNISSSFSMEGTGPFAGTGIEMKETANIEFLDDFLRNNQDTSIQIKDNIFNLLKTMILIMEKKQLFLKDIKLNDFIISHTKGAPDNFKIFLINMNKVHFGFFFIHKTDIKSLNKIFL